MLNWIHAHHVICTLIAYWLFSALVSPMPAPKPGGSPFYEWLYAVMHNLLQLAAGNIFRIPGVRQFLGNGAAGAAPPATPK